MQALYFCYGKILYFFMQKNLYHKLSGIFNSEQDDYFRRRKVCPTKINQDHHRGLSFLDMCFEISRIYIKNKLVKGLCNNEKRS